MVREAQCLSTISTLSRKTENQRRLSRQLDTRETTKLPKGRTQSHNTQFQILETTSISREVVTRETLRPSVTHLPQPVYYVQGRLPGKRGHRHKTMSQPMAPRNVRAFWEEKTNAGEAAPLVRR